MQGGNWLCLGCSQGGQFARQAAKWADSQVGYKMGAAAVNFDMRGAAGVGDCCKRAVSAVEIDTAVCAALTAGRP